MRLRFCRHDWYIHKQQHVNTFRWNLLIGGFAPLTFILATTFPGIMLMALSPLLWVENALLALALGFLAFIGTCGFMDEVYPGEPDPWKAKDTSCLKCGKMKFNYTKWHRKHLKKSEENRVKAIEDRRKQEEMAVIKKNNIKNAEKRYKFMLELY